jgi:hypothetical protein
VKKADSRPLLLSSLGDYFGAAGAPGSALLLDFFGFFVFLVDLEAFFFSALGASADGAPEGAGA